MVLTTTAKLICLRKRGGAPLFDAYPWYIFSGCGCGGQKIFEVLQEADHDKARHSGWSI